jgi:hypothetical protein
MRAALERDTIFGLSNKLIGIESHLHDADGVNAIVDVGSIAARAWYAPASSDPAKKRRTCVLSIGWFLGCKLRASHDLHKSKSGQALCIHCVDYGIVSSAMCRLRQYMYLVARAKDALVAQITGGTVKSSGLLQSHQK